MKDNGIKSNYKKIIKQAVDYEVKITSNSTKTPRFRNAGAATMKAYWKIPLRVIMNM